MDNGKLIMDNEEYELLSRTDRYYQLSIANSKLIKDAEKDLEKKVLTKYPALTLDEVKTLIVDHKWMDELSFRVLGEVDRLSHTLAGRVKELAERYAEPMPEIVKEVENLKEKVEGHLSKMGFDIKNN